MACAHTWVFLEKSEKRRVRACVCVPVCASVGVCVCVCVCVCVTGQHARNMTVAEFVRAHMAQSDQCTAGSSSDCAEAGQKNEEEDPEYARQQRVGLL